MLELLKYSQFCDPARQQLSGNLTLLVRGARLLEAQSFDRYRANHSQGVCTVQWWLPTWLTLGKSLHFLFVAAWSSYNTKIHENNKNEGLYIQFVKQRIVYATSVPYVAGTQFARLYLSNTSKLVHYDASSVKVVPRKVIFENDYAIFQPTGRTGFLHQSVGV